MGFTWSEYQSNVFDAVSDPDSGNLVIVARAGSAKTTTGVEAVNRLLKGTSVSSISLTSGSTNVPDVCFLAFNKSIADELSQKLPSGTTSSTFHSLGLQALRPFLKGYVKVEGYKIQKILNAMVQSNEIEKWKADFLSGAALRLVNLARDMGIGVLANDTDENWQQLIRHFEIELEIDDIDGENAEMVCIDLARKLLHRSNLQAVNDRVIDFGDMLYLCVKYPVPMHRFDVCFVDEAQDTNPIQIAIIKKILKPGGKLVAIGDDKQAIYGFRGASSDALDIIIREFSAETLPLSISYRCSKKVIERAQRYVPDIKSSDTAIEGYVGPVPEGWTFRNFTNKDVVLCRNTAPIIALAYKLINNKVPCKVLGREIGQGLISLIKSLKPQGIKGLEKKLSEYREAKVSQYMAKGEEGKALALDDKCESILAAIQSLPTDATVPQLIDHISSLFDNQGADVLTLCTIHKSKGLEFGTVYFYDSYLVPSKFARQPWQLIQENNLIYVAITRAKENLYYLNAKDIQWEPKQSSKSIQT